MKTIRYTHPMSRAGTRRASGKTTTGLNRNARALAQKTLYGGLLIGVLLATPRVVPATTAATDMYGGTPPSIVHFVTSGIIAMIVVCAVLFVVLFLWPRLRRKRWLRLVGYVFLAICAIPIRPFVASLWLQYKWQLLVLLAVLAVVHVRRVRRGKPGLLRKRTLLAAVLLFPVVVALSIMRQQSLEGDGCGRMARDKRVRPIFSLCEDDWRKKIVSAEPEGAPRHITQNPRTVFPSSDFKSLYCALAFQDLEYKQPLMKINRSTGEIEKVYYLYSPFRGECAPGEDVCFVVSSMKRTLLQIDDRRNVISREVRLVFYSPLFLGLDTKYGEVLMTPITLNNFYDTSWAVVNEKMAEELVVPVITEKLLAQWRRTGKVTSLSNCIWTYNWRTGKVLAVPQNGAAYPMSHGITIYGQKQEAVYSQNGGLDTKVYVAARPGLRMKGIPIGLYNTLMGMGVGNGMAIDDAGDQLFASFPIHGAVYVFDTETNSYKGRINLETGLRDLTFDPARRRLFVGGYLSGHIYVIDARTWKVVDKIFVGRKIRHISFSPELDRLFVTSANGCLEVKPY